MAVRKQVALYALFQSFVYDEPRAETCCEIGDYFMECNAYQSGNILVSNGGQYCTKGYGRRFYPTGLL
ncbi:MAG: hypothetical protein ACLTE2_13335 [Eubacteriales bacterium]